MKISIKKLMYIPIILSVLFFMEVNSIFAEGTRFSRGVNLTNWFQSSNVQSIQFSKYTKSDFINIKSLGCDVVRLPINLHGMTSGSPEYNLDPLLFAYLDEIVNWIEELKLNLILDNHYFDPEGDTNPNIGDILNPVWKQMAEHFKDRSMLLYFEILNEPHGIANSTWNSIQSGVINSIRDVDTVHTIIVGPANWNSYNSLNSMPEYSDTNLIYTFHFYDPFIFTHQGATWDHPSLAELKGVPFPYNPSTMPELPSSAIGSWVQYAYNDYSKDGNAQDVKKLIDIAASFKETRNIELFCGEFGVYIPNSNNEERVAWYELVRTYLEEKDISWTIWDYQGGFGLFEKGSNELFDYDLNIPLINALGFNEVEQYNFNVITDSIGFSFYNDYIETGIVQTSWTSGGVLNYLDDFEPIEGNYSILWQNVSQYNYIGFNFIPNRDLSLLVNREMSMEFYLKGDNPDKIFDLRFVDSKNDIPEDHPWRMRYTIDTSIIPFDNEWHLVEIPLSKFTEQGSWDNETWFEPIGDFEWHDIDRFEIVAEHGSLNGSSFWFDKIEIVDINVVNVKEPIILDKYSLEQNFPNPFNPTTTIAYSIPTQSNVTLRVFDVLGREVSTIVNREQPQGFYEILYDASILTSGIYYFKLQSGGFVDTKKMIFLK